MSRNFHQIKEKNFTSVCLYFTKKFLNQKTQFPGGQAWLVTHTCHPNYLQGTERRITVLGQPRQKVPKTLFQKKISLKARYQWFTPVILTGWEAETKNHGLRPAQADSSQDSISKINQSKMGWRCGSSSRAPALQAQNPESKFQSYQK
jgi:hypothetical protein